MTDTTTLMLAQTEGPPPPGAGSVPPTPGEGQPLTGAPGEAGGAPGGTSGDPFGPNFMLLLLLLLITMITFTVLGQRRDRKKRQAMIGSIKKHDRVQTVGGVIGSIVEVKPETIVLKVDEASNTKITFARSAIQQVLSGGPDGEAEDR